MPGFMMRAACLGVLVASISAFFSLASWSDHISSSKSSLLEFLSGATVGPVSLMVFAGIIAQLVVAFAFFSSIMKKYRRNSRLQKTPTFPEIDYRRHGSLLEFVNTEWTESRAPSASPSVSSGSKRTRSYSSSSRKSSLGSNKWGELDQIANLQRDLSRVLSRKTVDLMADQSFMDSLDEELCKWEFDIFDLAEKTDQSLVMIGMTCLEGNFEVQVDTIKLRKYLVEIDTHYTSAVYHNSLHAATVARSAFCMCKELGLGARLSTSMEFALVLAALIHDVAHPGFTAPFLAKAGDELSLRYSDDSPLERMHLAVAFGLLRKEENAFLSPTDLALVKGPIIHAVLGTDMAKHGQMLQRADALIDNLKHGGSEGSIPWYWPAKPPPSCKEPAQRQEWEVKEQEDFVMGLFLHAVDIASPTMPFDQFKRWNGLVQQEFHAQGDREKAEFGELISAQDGYDRTVSPLRLHNFTCGFLDFVVLPYFQKLDDLSKIRVATNKAGEVDLSVCLKNVVRNRQLLRDSAPPE